MTSDLAKLREHRFKELHDGKRKELAELTDDDLKKFIESSRADV